MKLVNKAEARDRTEAGNSAANYGAQRRTLEALFRHPAAHNLEWMDVVELVENIGTMDRTASGEDDVHVRANIT